jgi:hypothetical protein
MSADLLVTVETFEAAATEGGRIEVTMRITLEISDARALDVVLKLVGALAAARGASYPHPGTGRSA